MYVKEFLSFTEGSFPILTYIAYLSPFFLYVQLQNNHLLPISLWVMMGLPLMASDLRTL